MNPQQRKNDWKIFQSHSEFKSPIDTHLPSFVKTGGTQPEDGSVRDVQFHGVISCSDCEYFGVGRGFALAFPFEDRCIES